MNIALEKILRMDQNEFDAIDLNPNPEEDNLMIFYFPGEDYGFITPSKFVNLGEW